MFLLVDTEKFFGVFYCISEIIRKGFSSKIKSLGLDSESLKNYFTIFR